MTLDRCPQCGSDLPEHGRAWRDPVSGTEVTIRMCGNGHEHLKITTREPAAPRFRVREGEFDE